MIRNQQHEAQRLVKELQDLTEDLQIRRNKFRSQDVTTLVFRRPPSSDDLPLYLQARHNSEGIHTNSAGEPFSLHPDTPENAEHLRYEDWLLNRHAFVLPLKLHTSTYVQLHASVLFCDIEAEIDYLDQRRMLEWERQRSTGSPVASSVLSTQDSVDTSK